MTRPTTLALTATAALGSLSHADTTVVSFAKGATGNSGAGPAPKIPSPMQRCRRRESPSAMSSRASTSSHSLGGLHRSSAIRTTTARLACRTSPRVLPRGVEAAQGAILCASRGCSSVGRASASQAECRGFESRLPLSIARRGRLRRACGEVESLRSAGMGAQGRCSSQRANDKGTASLATQSP